MPDLDYPPDNTYDGLNLLMNLAGVNTFWLNDLHINDPDGIDNFESIISDLNGFYTADPTNRQYVHLSDSKKEALKVAQKKYTKPILLEINALAAFQDGVLFYINNDNCIWLCKYIDPKYISIIE